MEIVSFIAKPSANPVNPRPATSADTLTPNVPSAVIKPNIIIVTLLVRESSEVRFPSNFNRSAELVIIFFIIFARIKKTMNITTTPIALGSQRCRLFKKILYKFFHSLLTSCCPSQRNCLHINNSQEFSIPNNSILHFQFQNRLNNIY